MKIAIIGGGQLGMMMAEKAKESGHIVVSLDPNPNCSIVKFSDLHIAKDYNDEEVLEYINETCDVITYEFENVNLEVLTKYIDKLPQGTKALEVSRNRLIEKAYAYQLGIRVPKYCKVSTKSDVFFPSIVKTTTGGYDGKGQYKINSKTDIDHIEKIGSFEYICEEFIEFDYEISIVATRDNFGNIAFYPTPINTHKNGILHISRVDNSIPSMIVDKAQTYTRKILDELEYVGTLAVEYFVVGNEVIFNEFAPRPHNSGHYTMDGCNVSQFKNHVRAITGKKVIKPYLIDNTIMLNVLGQNGNYYLNSERCPNAVVHDYFKNSDRHNRKIGHINISFKDMNDYEKIISDLTKE